MKIVAFNRGFIDKELTDNVAVDIIPDSAVVLKNRPVFVPDFGSGWMASANLALRIGRLGRDISPKFAARYVDAATVAVRLMLPGSEISHSLLSATDSTLAPGEWLPIEEISDEPLSATVNTVPSAPIRLADEIAASVALASRFMTLKMGDIILCAPLSKPQPALPGTTLTATLGRHPATSVRFV